MSFFKELIKAFTPEIGGAFVVAPNDSDHTQIEFREISEEEAKQRKSGELKDSKGIAFFFWKSNGRDYQRTLTQAKECEFQLKARTNFDDWKDLKLREGIIAAENRRARAAEDLVGAVRSAATSKE